MVHPQDPRTSLTPFSQSIKPITTKANNQRICSPAKICLNKDVIQAHKIADLVKSKRKTMLSLDNLDFNILYKQV